MKDKLQERLLTALFGANRSYATWKEIAVRAESMREELDGMEEALSNEYQQGFDDGYEDGWFEGAQDARVMGSSWG